MNAHEANFDDLVGSTHNYGGPSYGNVASQSSSQAVSNPREVTKQGLVKMKALMEMGFKQGVLVPQARSDTAALRSLGLSSSDEEVIHRTAKEAMPLLVACSLVSSMWAANAATVSPSADTTDGHMHFTVANLNCKFHRSIEHPTTSRVLAAMFNDEWHFAHHAALPVASQFDDEGATSHTRFCKDYGDTGVEFFTFSRSVFDSRFPAPQCYPARQTLEACQVVARLHGLSETGVAYVQQDPAVIDQGVFHNDVISVGNGEVLFHHEDASLDTEEVLIELHDKLGRRGGHFRTICVPRSQIAVEDAVKPYLFSSQLLSKIDGSMLLVVPEECRNNPWAWNYLNQLTGDDDLIHEVKIFDLKQSMQNGGGPVCLRLRMALQKRELAAMDPGVIMNAGLYDTLVAWINRYYCDHLSETDLADPQLLLGCWMALDELTQILKLGSVYSFQLN